MLGYWKNPTATAATITPEGWLRTGDAGSVDPDGYLFLHDRIKDMIVSGGENIYPAEIENVLLGHPDVIDVAVIGVPDERWGETVKAIVVRAPTSSVDRRGAHRLVPGAAGPLQVPDVGGLRRDPAPQPDRQGAQARAARAVLGGAGPPHRLSPHPVKCPPEHGVPDLGRSVGRARRESR